MANFNKSFNFRNGVQVDNDNFIDTKFISSMLGDIAGARLVELLPLIKKKL